MEPVSTPTSNTPPTAGPKKPSMLAAHFKKAWGYYFLLALVLISNLYWMVDHRFVTTKVNKEIEGSKQNISEQSKVQLLQSSEKKLRLAMQTFAWAVRAAVLRQNKDEVDQYFLELVRNPDVAEVFLVDEETKTILVASNKKHEKMKFADLYDSAYLSKNEVTFEIKNNQYFLSAPLMSLDKRLGTLFLIVEPDTIKELTPDSRPDSLRKNKQKK